MKRSQYSRISFIAGGVSECNPHDKGWAVPSSHTSLPHLFFTVRVIKLKLLRVFLEQCKTKAPSTSLSPTCWPAFSTPARTLEQRVSHSSGTNARTDGFEEKLIPLIGIIKINGKIWCEPICFFPSEPWCTLEIWNLKGERHRLRWRVESTAYIGMEASRRTQIQATHCFRLPPSQRFTLVSHLAPGCSSTTWTCFEASWAHPDPQECFFFPSTVMRNDSFEKNPLDQSKEEEPFQQTLYPVRLLSTQLTSHAKYNRTLQKIHQSSCQYHLCIVYFSGRR